MYNRSNPYSTKHSQGKNEHFSFSPAFFQVPPPSHRRRFHHRVLGLSGSDAPLPAARVGEDVCLSGAMAHALREESSIYDGWIGVGVGGGGFVLFFPHSDGQPAVKVTMVVQ